MRSGIGIQRVDVAEELREDFPRLKAWCMWQGVPSRKSTRQAKERLAEMDDRVRGAPVGQFRTHAVAQAYRGFARQIGLDPDVDRSPLDQAIVQRLAAGRYATAGRVTDALRIAMLETGIPLWAIDGAHVHGWLRVRSDEQGRLVLCDDLRELTMLMADPPEDLQPHKRTETVIVYALTVGQVAPAAAEEAFWHVRQLVSDEAHVR